MNEWCVYVYIFGVLIKCFASRERCVEITFFRVVFFEYLVESIYVQRFGHVSTVGAFLLSKDFSPHKKIYINL